MPAAAAVVFALCWIFQVLCYVVIQPDLIFIGQYLTSLVISPSK